MKRRFSIFISYKSRQLRLWSNLSSRQALRLIRNAAGQIHPSASHLLIGAGCNGAPAANALKEREVGQRTNGAKGGTELANSIAMGINAHPSGIGSRRSNELSYPIQHLPDLAKQPGAAEFVLDELPFTPRDIKLTVLSIIGRKGHWLIHPQVDSKLESLARAERDSEVARRALACLRVLEAKRTANSDQDAKIDVFGSASS